MLWYNTITLIMNISACFCSAAQIPLSCYPQTLEDAFGCPSLCSICFGMSSTSFGHDLPLSLSIHPSRFSSLLSDISVPFQRRFFSIGPEEWEDVVENPFSTGERREERWFGLKTIFMEEKAEMEENGSTSFFFFSLSPPGSVALLMWFGFEDNQITARTPVFPSFWENQRTQTCIRHRRLTGAVCTKHCFIISIVFK